MLSLTKVPDELLRLIGMVPREQLNSIKCPVKNLSCILHLECEGDEDGEDSVGAARLAVHVGGRHGSTLVALNHQVVYLLHR